MYLFKHQGCPEQREMGNVLHVKSLIITDWDEQIRNQINDEIMKKGFICSHIRSAFDALPKKTHPWIYHQLIEFKNHFPHTCVSPICPPGGSVCLYTWLQAQLLWSIIIYSWMNKRATREIKKDYNVNDAHTRTVCKSSCI